MRVYGDPVPYKSTKFERRGRWLSPYADPDTEAWKKVVATWALTARPRPLLEGPLEARISFIMARPKRMKRTAGPLDVYHWRRPDWDNLSKACMDALKMIVFHDDGQIARALVEKLYGDRPGVEIFIQEIIGKEEAYGASKGIM